MNIAINKTDIDFQIKKLKDIMKTGFFLFNHIASMYDQPTLKLQKRFVVAMELREKILSTLEIGKNVIKVSDLAKRFNVHIVTISSHLQWLRNEKFIKTVYNNRQYVIFKIKSY